MKFRQRTSADEVRLDLSPLIDVVLLILIFLMVTASFIKTGSMKVNLPTANQSQEAPQGEALIIEVDSQGRFYVNSKAIRPEDGKDALKGALNREAGHNKEILVLIRGDEHAPLQAIVSVMNAAKASGLQRVQIITSKQK